MKKLLVPLALIGAGIAALLFNKDDVTPPNPAGDIPEPGITPEPETIQDPDPEPEITAVEQDKPNVFTAQSKAKLASTDDRLQLLFNEVLKETDITIIEGHRNKDRQHLLFSEGKSQVDYPDSKHNFDVSEAIDVAPYDKVIRGIDWNNHKAFYDLAAVVKNKASELGIPIRWGGDWDSDGDYTDQNFNDLGHFELAV